MGDLIYLSRFRDTWLTKKALAEEWNCSVRYVEKMQALGMPSRLVAGKRQYRRSVVESWMRENGYLQEGA